MMPVPVGYVASKNDAMLSRELAARKKRLQVIGWDTRRRFCEDMNNVVAFHAPRVHGGAKIAVRGLGECAPIFASRR